MAAHLSDEMRSQVIHLGQSGKAIYEIIRQTGVTRNSVSDILHKAGIKPAARPAMQPDQFTTYVANPDSDTQFPKPRIRVKAYSEVTTVYQNPINSPVRVVVIADTHDNPALEQDRFDHMGKFIADTAPDFVVHAGDWADFEFASRFEDWSSIHGRDRSPFKDEMDSLRSAIERLQTPLAHMSCPPKLITTLGNHDERVWLFENTHPECEGMMWSEFMSALSDWEVYPYRQYAFIEHVGFTHAPHNSGGKPYISKIPENSIANDATFSIVSGHTHKGAYRTVPKLGPQNQITLFNSGCALPYGYIKPYAQLSMTGWSWGIGTVDILDGRIVAHSIISMDELERRYG
jgi:predicted phosphodiesterase